MTDYVGTIPGLVPLPDWSKESLSDLKGHQKQDLVNGTENDAVAEVYREARAEVVDRQIEAGLDRIVEGQLRWDDMLTHPLAVHDAVETGGLRRYYDNNNFYRDPVVTDPITPDGDLTVDLEMTAERTDALQAVLPGPYSMSELATDDYYGTPDAFLGAIGEFLAAEVAAMPDHETLFVLEPSLVTSPPDETQVSTVDDAIDAIAAETTADVVVHTYWGALDERTHAHLVDTDVDAIGYDFVTAPDACLRLLSEYGSPGSVALGIVDGQNTRLESPSTVRERLSWVDEQLPGLDFETVYVTTNTELFYLPVNRYEEKLDVIGDAVSEVEA